MRKREASETKKCRPVAAKRRPLLSMAERICITAREAADLLGIGYVRVLDLARRGAIPHARIGATVIFRRDALERWIDEQCARSTDSELVHDNAADVKNIGFTA